MKSISNFQFIKVAFFVLVMVISSCSKNSVEPSGDFTFNVTNLNNRTPFAINTNRVEVKVAQSVEVGYNFSTPLPTNYKRSYFIDGIEIFDKEKNQWDTELRNAAGIFVSTYQSNTFPDGISPRKVGVYKLTKKYYFVENGENKVISGDLIVTVIPK
jgi:hypothetical protein